MNTKHLAASLLLLACLTVPARGDVHESGAVPKKDGAPKISAVPEKSTVPEKGSVELSVSGVYGYNSTYGNWGGTFLQAYLPVHKYLDILGCIQACTNNTMQACATLQPGYSLPVGRIYADASIMASPMFSKSTVDLVAALSVGYRFDYLDVRAGMFCRSIFDISAAGDKSDSADGGRCVVEPCNLLYRLAFQVRPSASRWNLGGGITNCTPYDYERMWQPMAFINGFCRIGDHFRINADVTVKPTGMFHLVASFYGIRTSAGLTYIF